MRQTHHQRIQEMKREKDRQRQLAVVGKLKTPTIWHGGCLSCVQQERMGMNYCLGCQYFDAQWDKPDLSKKAYEVGVKQAFGQCQYPNKTHCKSSLGCDACQWSEDEMDEIDEALKQTTYAQLEDELFEI